MRRKLSQQFFMIIPILFITINSFTMKKHSKSNIQYKDTKLLEENVLSLVYSGEQGAQEILNKINTIVKNTSKETLEFEKKNLTKYFGLFKDYYKTHLFIKAMGAIK
ncbi:hypothetical protein ACFLYU_03435 [Candidatus Dependentiae bacterium]